MTMIANSELPPMIAGSNQVGEEAEVGGSVTVVTVSSAVWEQGEGQEEDGWEHQRVAGEEKRINTHIPRL